MGCAGTFPESRHARRLAIRRRLRSPAKQIKSCPASSSTPPSIFPLCGSETLRFSLRAVLRAKGEAQESPLWLSVVVLEELLVGARDARLKKLLARLERDFERAGRLLIPLQSDWTACGQVLAYIGERYGYEEVGRARMTNDALIAMSAARQGITVLTLNDDDYRKIAGIRPFDWERV